MLTQLATKMTLITKVFSKSRRLGLLEYEKQIQLC